MDKLKSSWTAIMLFCCGIMASLVFTAYGGEIDPQLLEANLSGQDVHVIIYLENQPTFNIAREIQSTYTPAIRALREQAKNILPQTSPEIPLRTPQEEKEYLETYVPALTQTQREELRAVLNQIDDISGEMRREIYSKIREAIDPQQGVLIFFLMSQGGTVLYKLVSLNAITATVPYDNLHDIADLPEVAYIEWDRPGELMLDISTQAIGANTFWDNSYTGGVFDVGIVDTGVDSSHPALSSHTTYDTSFHETDTNPDDTDGHGTHVAGIVASTDSTYKGAAFGLDAIINAKVGLEPDLPTRESYAMAAFDWAAGEVSDPAEIVTCSMGYELAAYDDTPFSRFFDAWTDNFLATGTFAAGNEWHYNEKTLFYPGNSYNLLIIGNISDGDSPSRTNDYIWESSSSGPTANDRKKPDLVAPGTIITSLNADWELGQWFMEKTGTSMATPHVAGCALLLMDAGITDPRTIKAVLINTAEDSLPGAPSCPHDDCDPPGWDRVYGWGYVDMNLAYIHKDDYFENIVYPNGQEGDFVFYKGFMYDTDKATMVWHRHAVYNGPDYPNQWSDLNWLAMRLYSYDTGDQIDISNSHKDNVQQVKGSSQAGEDVIIKVYAVDPGFFAVDAEHFSLATPELFNTASIPNIEIMPISSIPVVALDDTLTMSYRFTNKGEVKAHNINVDISVPTGVDKISGPSTDNFDLLPDGYQDVSWELKTTINGAKTCTLSAKTTSYGEFFLSSEKDIVYAGNTNWSGTNNITRDVSVYSDVTLTIEPGSLLEFATNDRSHSGEDTTRCELVVQGSLIAEGTVSEPIVFTSIGAAPQPGDWYGIRFLDSSDDSTCVVKNCHIGYALIGIYCNKALPEISQNQIADCEYGIYCHEASPEISANEIGSCTYGIICENNASPDIAHNNLYDISTWGIYCLSGCSPYVVSDTLIGKGASDSRGINCLNSSLQIQGGVVENFEFGINCCGGDPVISGVQLSDNSEYGIACNVSGIPQGDNPCGPCSSMITDNRIQGSEYGLRLGASAEAYISANIIKYNQLGIYSDNSASVVFGNEIRHNDSVGVFCSGNNLPNLGDLSNADTTDDGHNNIWDNQSWEVFNSASDTVQAENNWWGPSYPPDSSQFSGLVDYIPASEISFDTTAPAAISDLSIGLIKVPPDSGIVLSWSAVTMDVGGKLEFISHYVIFRDTSPDFEPSSQESLAAVPYTSSDYFDSGGVGHSVNYFYVVKAVDYGNNKSDASNMVGEFDRGLTEKGDWTEPPPVQ